MKILFLHKPNDSRADRARDFLVRAGCDVAAYAGQWHTPLPGGAELWHGDALVSYLSRWVVPKSLLDSAKLALNFHPAPPEYPGIGGSNWAIYDGAPSFGVTCHHMAPRVDAGPIVATRRFPIFAADDVASLSERTWDHLLAMFYDVMGEVVTGGNLSASNATWGGTRHTRAELDALSQITLGMDEHEVRRRMRATTYGQFKPSLVVGGKKLSLG